MSELRSTLSCGCTWPLAVTEDTRSRRCTCSVRTSTALLPRLAAVRPPIASATSTTPPNTDIFTRLLMATVLSVELAEGTSDRVLERGECLMEVVDGVHAIDQGLLVGAARRRDVEEGGGAHFIALLGEGQLFLRLLRVLLLQLDRLHPRHERQVRLRDVGGEGQVLRLHLVH